MFADDGLYVVCLWYVDNSPLRRCRIDTNLCAPAILYASLESIAFEYNQNRGWGLVVSQLPFLALLLGCLVAAGGNIYSNIYYGKRLVANHFKPVPEARLLPMMYGGFAFSGGLFLFGCKLASSTCQRFTCH